MTTADDLRTALVYLSKREKELAALFDAGCAPNQRVEREYERVTSAIGTIEKMLREPRQGRMI